MAPTFNIDFLIHPVLALHSFLWWIPTAVTSGLSFAHQAAADFMVWNSFLAFVPLVLALALYARRPQTALVLGVLCGACLVFKAPSVIRGLRVLAANIPTEFVLGMVGVFGVLLAVVLFKPQWRSTVLYTVGTLVFMVFLPNAPYVLTDVLHFVETARVQPSMTVMLLSVVPMYTAYVVCGWSAYVLALTLMSADLQRFVPRVSRRTIQGLVHALCAIGVYLGRFDRWNSWDLLSQPGMVLQSLFTALTTPRSFSIIFLSFIIVAALFEVWQLVLRALSREVQHYPRMQRVISSR